MTYHLSLDPDRVRLGDKTFRLFVPRQQVEQAVSALAARISDDYRGKSAPVFVGVLNGAFIFMADLVRRLDIPCETSFVKLSSYQGTESTGTIRQAIGPSDALRGRHVILVEDIVDTGATIDYLFEALTPYEPASVAVATLAFKREAYRSTRPIDYVALEVPNRFVVGFGLDYDQRGRNLNAVYELDE